MSGSSICKGHRSWTTSDFSLRNSMSEKMVFEIATCNLDIVRRL